MSHGKEADYRYDLQREQQDEAHPRRLQADELLMLGAYGTCITREVIPPFEFYPAPQIKPDVLDLLARCADVIAACIEVPGMASAGAVHDEIRTLLKETDRG